MMKKVFIVLIFFLIGSVLIVGQTTDTPQMEYWSGGSLNLDLTMDFNSTGLNSNAGTFGGINSSSISNGITSVYGNPADLANIRSSQFFFDTNFPITTSMLGFKSDDLMSPEDVGDQTDSFLEDTTLFVYNEENFRKDTDVNDLDLTLKKGGLSSFAFGYPITSRLVFGIGYAQPLDFSMDMQLTNLQTNLKTVKEVGNNETDIDLIFNSSFLMDVSFRMNTLSFSLGGNLIGNKTSDNLDLGLSVNRYFLHNDMDFFFHSNGMIVLNNSSEYYFNDPKDENLDFEGGETNKLFWRARGSFEATEWGFRIGAHFAPRNTIPFVEFSLIYDHVPKFKLKDENAFTESYQPKFLVGRFQGEDEEQMDVVIDSLNLAKPNLTKPTFNYFSDQANITIPSSLTFGLDFQIAEKHTLALNIVSYMDELTYEFSKYKVGKSSAAGFKMGMDLVFPEKLEGWNWALLPVRLLFLDFDGLLLQAFGESTGYSNPHYRIGGGFMSGDPIVEGIADEDQAASLEDALTPSLPTGFALGREYTVLENLKVFTLVFGYPDMFMKFAFLYQF